MAFPTTYPDVNALVNDLLANVQPVLGAHFVGMYLFGSLTGSDFDEDSDIDVLVVTDEDPGAETFSALQTMHEQLARRDSVWAIQLEVSYIPQQALRHYDPARACHPHLDRGPHETLHWQLHSSSWVVQRYVLRERGIVLKGPAPSTLIDPVSGDDLRWAMLPLINEWAAEIAVEETRPRQRGGQSYAVLTMCRILYTLALGDVVSKRAAATWAQKTIDPRWASLIARTWTSRHNPAMAADPDEVNETAAFVMFTLERSQDYFRLISPDL